MSFLSKYNIKKKWKKTLRQDIHSWMHLFLDSRSLKPNDTFRLFFPINNSKMNEEIHIYLLIYRLIWLIDFHRSMCGYVYEQYVTFLAFLTGTYVID
jgi:hypothetical protein